MQADYRSRARSNVRPITRTRAGVPGNQIGDVRIGHVASCRGALEFGRCRGMADIGQAAPIRLDQRRRVLTRCTAHLTDKHARRAKLAAVGCPIGFRGLPRSASVRVEPTHLGEIFT